MSKFLLIFTLLIFSGLTTKLISSDNGSVSDIKVSYFTDPEDEEKDSVDALTVFSAKIKNKTIYLNWRVLNPKNISYFEIYKLNPKNKEYEPLDDSRVKADEYFDKSMKSETEIIYMYDFIDEPERDGVYFYKLAGFSSNGKALFETEEIKIGITGIRNFKLEQNTPNPFNPTTNITYELYDESSVRLRVFDLIGKEIATLVDSRQAKGTYTVQFDASKIANLTSGIYFYKLETERYSEVKKMILTK